MSDLVKINSNAKVDISKGRSDAFDAAARRFWRFINTLDLSPTAYKKLVDIVCKQVSVAEHDAFLFGFDMAASLMHDHHSGKV